MRQPCALLFWTEKLSRVPRARMTLDSLAHSQFLLFFFPRVGAGAKCYTLLVVIHV